MNRCCASHEGPEEDAMKLKGLLITGMLLAVGATVAGHDAGAQDKKLKFYVNFIGGPEIQFFAVVKRGVEGAGKDLRVEAIYNAPESCRINLQTHLPQSHRAAKPD